MHGGCGCKKKAVHKRGSGRGKKRKRRASGVVFKGSGVLLTGAGVPQKKMRRTIVGGRVRI